MFELLKEEMNCLHFFRKENLEVPLWACIEGKMGRAWVDKKDNPSMAMVIVADFCYLLGSISSNSLDLNIDELIEKCKRKVIVAEDSTWVSIIERFCPNGLNIFTRYSIKKEFDVFDKSVLISYINAIDSKFNIVSIDEALFSKVLEDSFMADCCSNYSSLEEYMKHGIGYAITHNGEIIAAASSYSYCEGSIEVTIGTKENYRRKGLALAVAARLILGCMERGIYPSWDAANVESVALAEKLGYHFDKEYEVYSIS
jgi:hypothetical protein